VWCLVVLAATAMAVADAFYLVAVARDRATKLFSASLVDIDTMDVVKTQKLPVPAGFERLAFVRSDVNVTHIYLTAFNHSRYYVTLDTMTLAVKSVFETKEEWVGMGGVVDEDPYNFALRRTDEIESSVIVARLNITSGATSGPEIGLPPEYVYDWQYAGTRGGWVWTLCRTGFAPYSRPFLIGTSIYDPAKGVLKVPLNAINIRIFPFDDIVGVMWADDDWHIGFIDLETGTLETFLGNLGDYEWLRVLAADTTPYGELIALYRNLDETQPPSGILRFMPSRHEKHSEMASSAPNEEPIPFEDYIIALAVCK